jgi:hypothetical protein
MSLNINWTIFYQVNFCSVKNAVKKMKTALLIAVLAETGWALLKTIRATLKTTIATQYMSRRRRAQASG